MADLTILLEPQQGRSPSGNIFYVLRALMRDARFDEYKICYAAKKSSMSMFEDLLSNYEMFERVELVELNSERYVHILATAKYLITDTAFPTYYVKRDDQVVWNTWHGTPLKTLGRSDKGDAYRLGNIQRNLACSSFLSFPNQHTKKCLVEDYMIQNLGTPEILLAGYPRNTVLFNTESPSKFFEENDLSDKTVYAYMPTWRYLKDGLPARMGGIDTLTYLFQIDARLDDDEVMLVSVHPLAKGRIDFKYFDHILPFPADWETYDVLRKCDLLITDYSSVMFDFALTKKKIVLFSYDKFQYLTERGMYFPYEDLPFPQVESVTELLAEIRAPKKYDDAKFVTQFCPFETPDATQNLINTVFFDAKGNIERSILETDGKKCCDLCRQSCSKWNYDIFKKSL